METPHNILNNQVLIKYFNHEESFVEYDKHNVEDVFDVALQAPFYTVAYGLSEREFKKRVFQNKVLSEVYKFTLEDGSYYLLRVKSTIFPQ